jgi:drug/metabolite transporter (DMT)-like permease
MTETALRAPAMRVALALGTVYLVWGSTYFAIRVALESIPPFFMAGARYLFAGAVLYLVCRLTGSERPTWRHWRSSLLLGCLLLLVGNGGVVWAEQKVNSGLAALMVSTEPLFIVGLVWWSARQRPASRVLVGMALGFIGLVVLLSPGAGGGMPLTATIALLLASMAWASGSLYSIRAELPRSPFLGTAMEMLCGGAVLAIAGALTGEGSRFVPALVTGRSILALAYLSIFGALLAFTAYIWLLRKAPPVLVSTYAYVNPVVAVFVGWLAGHELLSVGTLVAAAIILGGVALIVSAPAQHSSAPGEKDGATRVTANAAAARPPSATLPHSGGSVAVEAERESDALVTH